MHAVPAPGGVVDRVEARGDAPLVSIPEHLSERLTIEARQHQRPPDVQPGSAAPERPFDVVRRERGARARVVEKRAGAIARVEHERSRGQLVALAEVVGTEPARLCLAFHHVAEQVAPDAAAQRSRRAELDQRGGG